MFDVHALAINVIAIPPSASPCIHRLEYTERLDQFFITLCASQTIRLLVLSSYHDDWLLEGWRQFLLFCGHLMTLDPGHTAPAK